MLAAAHVTTIKTSCIPSAAVTAKGADGVSRIVSITLSCEPAAVTAKVFVDASYDGDVMVLAGDVDYTAGREASSQYNESFAGARAPGWVGVGGPKNIPALKADGTLLKYVSNVSDLKPPGSADDALMAFQHRMCISGDEDRVPWPAPKGYNPDDFELMQRVLDATGSANSFTHMPPGAYHGYPGPKKKYDLCCGITVAASDQPTLNKGWASASWERRAEITAEHTYFELGTFHYLANDPKVPAAIRAKYQQYGLCRDEFVDNDFMPIQLYVRISNRLVGDYVMTQNNMCRPTIKPDSIAVGDWSFDEHMTGKYAVPDGNGGHTVMLEGNFWPSVEQGCGSALRSDHGSANEYDVPYRAIIPKRGTGGNLLVPVALSASAVAYSSTRIESMFMYVGTAAGVAAKQVVDGSAATVQDVNVTQVQAVLTSAQFKQLIHSPGAGPPGPPPGPAPQFYNVSGAGSPSWNGQYVRAGSVDDSTHDGAGGLLFTSTSCSSCSLYAEGGDWRLAVAGKELFYVNGSPAALPPTGGWVVANGTAPAPTLLAGPTTIAL
jgi:hypothetical protein